MGLHGNVCGCRGWYGVVWAVGRCTGFYGGVGSCMAFVDCRGMYGTV